MTGRRTTAAKKTTTRKTPRTKSSQKKRATTRSKATAKKSNAKTPAKKMSQIDAAVAVLGKAKEPMNCKAMVEAMAKQGLWQSPGGATPHSTLYASILREINAKKKDARFKKTDRGHFTLTDRK